MTDSLRAQHILRRDYVLDRERHAVVRRPQPDEPPVVPRLPPQPVGWPTRAWHRLWRWLWRLG